MKITVEFDSLEQFDAIMRPLSRTAAAPPMAAPPMAAPPMAAPPMAAPPMAAPPMAAPPMAAPPMAAPPMAAPPMANGSGPQITPAQLAAAMQQYARKYTPKALKDVLSQHGWTKTSDIPAERFADAYNLFNV